MALEMALDASAYGYLVLRFPAADVCKELDMVLDAILERSAAASRAPLNLVK